MDFLNKKICILGLGQTGRSCIDFLENKGAELFLMDSRKGLNPDHFPKNFPLYLGLDEKILAQMDLIVASPGVALSTPELQKALNKNIPVIGDIELFCQFADKPILAITGSNGKSTVTSLVAEMVKCSGLNVGMGGNIGIPALSLLDKGCDIYVLELSSFQLETTYSLKAQGATVLNISEDHLNRYRDLEDYRQAKLKIYQNAHLCIANSEDPLTYKKSSAQIIEKTLHFFGEEKGDYCIQTFENKRFLMAKGEKVLACEDLGITGRHNEMNALASIALAQSVNLPMEGIKKALKTFRGLDHRFQLACFKEGVRWINDSKATNVGSTLAALSGLSFDNGTLHLLLGGDGKEADFSPLLPYLNHSNIRCYCFGKDGKTLSELSNNAKLFETMFEAMAVIKKIVVNGDTVLLSPACASLDQFKSFEERGEIFTQLARGN